MRLGEQLCRALFATRVRFFPLLISLLPHRLHGFSCQLNPMRMHPSTPLSPSFPCYSLTITNAHTQLGPTVGAEARQG